MTNNTTSLLDKIAEAFEDAKIEVLAAVLTAKLTNQEALAKEFPTVLELCSIMLSLVKASGVDNGKMPDYLPQVLTYLYINYRLLHGEIEAQLRLRRSKVQQLCNNIINRNNTKAEQELQDIIKDVISNPIIAFLVKRYKEDKQKVITELENIINKLDTNNPNEKQVKAILLLLKAMLENPTQEQLTKLAEQVKQLLD